MKYNYLITVFFTSINSLEIWAKNSKNKKLLKEVLNSFKIFKIFFKLKIGILADEMGLGKTIMGISIIHKSLI
jgi:hypothetical protein